MSLWEAVLMPALRTAPVKPAAASPLGRIVTTREVAELRRRVTRTANPCGCKSGAVMTVVALVVWPAWRIWSGLPDGLSGLAVSLAAWVGVIVASAAAGKLGAIAVGRWRHKRLRRQLQEALAATNRGE